MSKKDKITEDLKDLRFWRGSFVLIAFTLGSWLVSNFEIFKTVKYLLGIIAEILVFFEIAALNKRIKEKIKILEEID